MTPAKILVVDDEPDLEVLVRQRFRRQVNDGAYLFRFARDGEEALDLLRCEPDIAVVLTDINMPRMDGLTLLGHLQGLARRPRAVVVSAYGDMTNIRTAMNRGAFDFLTKPIDFADLETTLIKSLGDHRVLQEMDQQRRDAEQARANLARYFSPNLASHLAANPDALGSNGERRDLTFLFTDLTGFTPLTEALDPAAILSLMNHYIGGLSRVIFDHGGTIVSVVGDALHAMFGAPLVQPDHAVRAVACARALDRLAVDFAGDHQAKGISMGATRIGVHSGSAIVGDVGGEAFFHYTAYGDAINTAQRLERANKQLGIRICVSAVTAALVPDFRGRPIGTLLLRGKDKGIMAFEPLEDSLTDEAAEAYGLAFSRLEAGDPGAIQHFAAYVGTYGNDPLATFHLKRLLAGEKGVVVAIGND